MAEASFIDFVFKSFDPANWRMGTLIYQAGGIQKAQAYGVLLAGTVHAGVGELYEVRIKLLPRGRGVQWMECSCPQYRRHNQKCAHMAAFCLYLDQDEPELLEKLQLRGGLADVYLEDDSHQARTQFETSGRGGGVLSGIFARQEGEFLFQAQGSETPTKTDISHIDHISYHESGGVLVSIRLSGQRKVQYVLNVDDALSLLKDSAILAFCETEMKKHQNLHLNAHRFFYIAPAQEGVVVIKKFEVYGLTSPREIVAEQLTSTFIGNRGFFHPDLGLVPFDDEWDMAHISQWNEYPASAYLKDDTAALLFETQLSRLKNVAEVKVHASLESWKVQNLSSPEQIHLNESKDGRLTMNLKEKIAGEFSLLDIVKARSQGRKYLKGAEGWVKVGEEYDWIVNQVSSQGITFSPLDVIRLREQLGGQVEIKGEGVVIKRLREGLVSLKDLETPSLKRTKLTLRDYQKEGVKWLWWLYQNSFGGLLADDMGLGKTHQAMALMACVGFKEPGGRSLVVCPTSVMDHWIDKIERFVPNLKVVKYYGSHRHPKELRVKGEHVIIVTSYGVLLRDYEMFSQEIWSVVILDEAQLVKNQTTRTYHAACHIPSRMRLCLTGTPLENDLMELRNLFNFILPNYLGTEKDFRKKYMKSQEERDIVAELELQRYIHPFKLRRKKSEVLKELPDKVEDIRYCHLNQRQYQLYSEALALKGMPLVEQLTQTESKVSYVHIFAIISMLKQICDDPAILDPRYASYGSGKLDVLEEILYEAMESDQKVVIFSQYAKMIDRLSLFLKARDISHVCLTGSTRNRGAVVKKFQEDHSVKVFLGSLLAGGTGIDLTSASIVIHFDRWWNSAKENQATDRIHRIGQERHVQVYKLVTKNTLEEKIDQLIHRKREIFDRFVEQDSQMFQHLSREDLLELLAPPKDIPEVEEES